jgi:two-component system, NarL family, nitrate/nitrite response regulator NarL
MPTALSVVLADDHVVFLDALTTVLTQMGHRVEGVATSRSAMVDHVRSQQPDVCVTDTSFADGPVVDVLSGLVDECPRTKIILLTADGSPETLRQALNAGASAFVHKTRGVSVLVETLRRVGTGEMVIDGSFSGPRTRGEDAPVEFRRLAAYLTPRELECLALLAQGLDTTAMAGQLGISPATVRTHVQALLVKLGVHSRLEAASIAMRHGLVSATASESGAESMASHGAHSVTSLNWRREKPARGW